MVVVLDLCLLGLLSNVAPGAWDHTWQFSVHNQGPVAVVDYQIAIDLHEFDLELNQFAPRGADLRFRLSPNGTNLCHWIEEWNEFDGRARVWVRIPYIAGNDTKTLFLLGGNPGAHDLSNGFDTFHYFDRGDSTNLHESMSGEIDLRRHAEQSQPQILDGYRLARFHPHRDNPVFVPAMPPAWDDDRVRDPELMLDERGFWQARMGGL